MSMLAVSCPSCLSTNLSQTLEPSGSRHYARLTCGQCGKYIQWVSKPSKQTDISILRLLKHPNLLEWQREFLKLIVYRTPNKAEAIVVAAIAVRLDLAGWTQVDLKSDKQEARQMTLDI